ncbi:antitoxin Xre/MbcA/ParS toxin-binding domain-containing protein [Bosea sp. (in: a-proteobacteria)]|uniref:antitoxin Xre/MbcA/ParS toxin-binding domain-containing protein n=1 Tax=Bosea sp. (in: a-proteobacteria) TaxID=1871050 RepID=UPI001AD40B36|nr:antitoxin Xre/MbcA/ParS toxin-binding domain-containing protein [Bosea sp. (in: a-proteobacteria)]MBN9441408.1 DUF2384 domain-containing protein [Bosea sp. (in: a-proteobacteria)]
MNNAMVLTTAANDLFRIWGVHGEAAISMMGGRDETPAGVLDRVIILLCINEALKRIFSEPLRIRHWLHSPNTIFHDHSPLQLMAHGDLASLRRIYAYLQAESRS